MISQPKSEAAEALPRAIGRSSMALAIFAKVVSQPRRVLHSLQVLDQAVSMSLMTLILASTRPCCWWALGVDEQAETFDEDLVPSLGEQTVAF